MIPDAHDPSKKHPPMMTTADLSLRFDPAYEKISRRFHQDPQAFRRRLRPRLVQADPPRHGPARALPRPRGAGRRADLAGPGAGGRPPADRCAGRRRAEGQDPGSGLSVRELVSTAWASASTFRGSDKRGGANGARIRLAPQKDWEANQPAQLAQGAGCARSHPARRSTRRRAVTGGKKVSLADLIVLAGGAAVEAGGQGRRHGRGALHPGPHRRHAGADRCESFAVLEPQADGFRNYQKRQLHTCRPRRCWSTRRSC
jgi:catalase-peroxidase